MLSEFDLRPYQQKIREHIKAHPACALWVDCGLGKTVSALSAVLDLMASFDAYKVLVVGPKRVASKVWSDEVKEWSHLSGLRVSLIIGKPEERIAGIHADADIYCINRENVAWLKQYFMHSSGRKLRFKWPWDMLIIDESSSFKHQSSGRWKALRSLRKFFSRVVELTGTPATNGYINLWAQIALLDKGERLGFTEKAFRQRWMNAPSKYDPAGKWEMKPGAREQIQEQLKDIVISMSAEDYLDLPPVMINPIRVRLSRKEMAVYKEMAKEKVIEMRGKKITAVNAGVLSGKLLQLANGAIYYTEDDKRGFVEFHDQKTEALLELLEHIEGPALLAYNYKSDVERLTPVLNKWCKANGKTWRVLSTKQDEDDWNADKIDILMLHPDSAGHGLNMHKGSAETIIWYGLNWSLELWIQLNARLAGGHRRIGKNVVINVIMAEGTVDEVVVDRLEFNEADQQGLLDAFNVYAQELIDEHSK